MTQLITLNDVSVLLPSRIHRSRRPHAARLTADLLASIEALPTASHSLVPEAVDDTDLEHFKSWAVSFIRALPTTQGESHGNC